MATKVKPTRLNVTGTPQAWDVPMYVDADSFQWWAWWWSWDVVWPASSTDWHLAVFDWATGKLIKDWWSVPTVPTNISSFNNDSWYLTSATWVTSVNGNTGAVTVTSDVTVSSQTGNVLTSWMSIWAWLESDYQNLGNYDSNTLYLTIE